MYIKQLQEEAAGFTFGKGRNLIKPFSSFDQLWLLLQSTNFEDALRDFEFYLFIRKKVFWILDRNYDSITWLKFKEISGTETNQRIVTISDQILLTYFSDDLSHTDLEGISLLKDEYNSLTAYRINSARGSNSKAGSN